MTHSETFVTKPKHVLVCYRIRLTKTDAQIHQNWQVFSVQNAGDTSKTYKDEVLSRLNNQ
jgi:hypothetical protein